jgi:hypothetical protein
MSDAIWFNDYTMLFDKKRILEFFPSSDHSYPEKINAMSRFIIYFSVILAVSKKKMRYLAIALSVLFVIWVSVNNKEESFSQQQATDYKCQAPTIDNPYMNVLLSDNTTRPEACRDVIEEADAKWRQGLYQNFDDVFNRKNSERQFYTMPNTTTPNKQKEFALWLYGNPNETCKEKNMNCTGQENGGG